LLVAAGVGIYVRWSDWRQLAAADTARSDERLEIARELHDMVGHHLTGIVVQAQAARHLSGRPSEADRAALQQIERAGTEALVTMRRMVGALRDDAPTAAAPDWSDILRLTSNSATPARIATASITAAVRDMDATLAPSVHRIVAESPTNVERHCRDVKAIEVAVFTQGNDLVVTVRNDGSSATSTAPGGFGIVGMRERATSLGGSLSAGSVAGGGWLVRAELPMHGHP
jgi:signal transduction histidine kinase